MAKRNKPVANGWNDVAEALKEAGALGREVQKKGVCQKHNM
jgi:hypothetical protein